MRSVSVCQKTGLRRGAWTQEEDRLLSAYIKRYGLWNWREIPKYAGLSRCGKSCRLRWLNYLRPDIKRGNFTIEEDEIITNHIQKFGQRWSAIAKNLPGRTDNEVKNHWHTSLKKQSKISAALEPKRVKHGKSRRPLALNNPVHPGSRNSYILESSAVVTLQQEKSSDSSVSTSDSESVSTENEATNGEISSEGDVLFPGELFSKPISPEDAHVWDDSSSVWIDSLITDPFSLIEEALYGYELYNPHSMGFVFNQ